MLIQHARDCLLGCRTDHALFFSTVLEKNESRNAFDAEALRDRRVVVHVKLHDARVARVFFSHSLDGGRKHATWRTPRGPKIYQNGKIRFEDVIFKSAITGFFYMLTHLCFQLLKVLTISIRSNAKTEPDSDRCRQFHGKAQGTCLPQPTMSYPWSFRYAVSLPKHWAEYKSKSLRGFFQA